MNFYRLLFALCLAALIVGPASAKDIQHDAEHYVLLHQYADQWATEDEEIEQRLVEIRERNDGKRCQFDNGSPLTPRAVPQHEHQAG